MHYISQFVKDKSSRKFNKVLSATNEFKVTQIVDNGQMIQLTLIENVSTEPISQKQMIIENVSKKLDSETNYLPNSFMVTIQNSTQLENLSEYSFFEGKNFEDKTSVFVCKDFSCSLHLHTLDEINSHL